MTQIDTVKKSGPIDNVDDEGDSSDSDAIESSHCDEESSDYDEAAQKAEERRKFEQILADKNLMRVKRGATLKGHQPYEILINKLIDGLETPEIVKSKTLPRPDIPEEENFVNVGNSDD